MPNLQSWHREDRRKAPRIKKLLTCEPTRKKRHPSQESAILHVAYLQAQGTAGFGLKVYGPCIFCRSWHVGHLPGSAKAES